jgi:hypothetical protein
MRQFLRDLGNQEWWWYAALIVWFALLVVNITEGLADTLTFLAITVIGFGLGWLSSRI